MQISRHWRLNGQRYRLEGSRWPNGELSVQPPPHNSTRKEIMIGSAIEEQRRVGALLVVLSDNGEVWLIPDELKLESASGFNTPFFVYGSEEERWGLPGGGRQGSETIGQTLTRELREETDGSITFNNNELRLANQEMMVVDQVRFGGNGEALCIDRFGVWVCIANVQSTGDLYNQMKTVGQWMPVNQLLSYWQENKLELYKFRPQVFAAVALATNEAFAVNLGLLNEHLISRGNQIARQYSLPINNGVVGLDGRQNPQANELVNLF